MSEGVKPTSGGPARCPTGPCDECAGPHHFNDGYAAFADEDPDHPAAKAGHEAWWECKHCEAWKNEVADEIDRLRNELRKANAQWAEETQAHAAFAKMATADLEKLVSERDEALARVADLEAEARK